MAERDELLGVISWSSRATRAARPLVLFVVLALVAAFFASASGTARAADVDSTPNDSTWRNTQHIVNDTPYELRLLDSTKTEMTEWLQAAAPVIRPHEHVASMIRNTPAALGHGLAQLLTYGLYLDGKYDGMMVLASGVDCEKNAALVCLDFHRWQQTWITTTNQPWKVFARWGNNDGPPANWETQFFLEQRSRSNSPGSFQATMPKFELSSAQSGGAGSVVAEPPATASGLNAGLGPWGVTEQIDNNSPYIFKKVMTWSSKGTLFLSGFPDVMLSGRQYQTLFANYATLNGPNAFAMYEAVDPRLPAGRNHLGAVIIEAATNCEFGAKVPDIPTTCIVFHSASFSVASAIAQYQLQSHATSSGFPPLNLVVDTLITGSANPPPPTTTTLAPTPPTLDCASEVHAQVGVATTNLHLCSSDGRPLPDLAVVQGALPAGTTLQRAPDASGTEAVLAGTPSEAGRFPVRIRAASGASKVEADVTIVVAAPPAPTTTLAPAGRAVSFRLPDNLSAHAITPGPDGALWFTSFANAIGRMATDGSVTSFRGDGIDNPSGIALGPDGALWFTNTGNDSIGRITTAGVVTNFHGDGISRPSGITAGPDGALWFTNTGVDSVGRISVTGDVSRFAGAKYGQPQGITTGPDGNLWYTSINQNSITRLTTSGRVASFTSDDVSSPDRIVAGPDGNLWFTNSSRHSIGRITPAGVITKFSDDSIRDPSDLTVGPDGNLWFTDSSNHAIGRMTTSGAATDFVDRNNIFSPTAIAAGPDGALWFVNSNPTIGRVTS